MSLNRKALLGHKIRRTRSEAGLSQADMAAALGISPSYLNLIERNQRPVTVPLLLKLGQVFDVDLLTFAEDEESHLAAQLKALFSDPLFDGQSIAERELRDLVGQAPAAARAVLTLWRGYHGAQEKLQAMAEAISRDPGLAADALATAPTRVFPVEEVRDFFLQHDNHFPSLETLAEQLVAELGVPDPPALYGAAIAHLATLHQLQVRLYPREGMAGSLRRMDRHGRRLLVNEMLPAPARTFQVLVQMAWLRGAGAIDRVAGAYAFQSEEARQLARSGLANYVAGAVMMPYDRFLEAARAERYDIQVLARRFEASLEQVCHRLTTLARPGARGVPFFLIRTDKAGNISKRFSARAMAFARLGGSCPRWVVYEALRVPGTLHTQLGAMADGTGWLSVAFAITQPPLAPGQPPQEFALALGCETAHGDAIVYGDGYDLKRLSGAVPIGMNCRLCERLDCAQRAHPPLNHRLIVDEHHRGPAPYGLRRG